MIANIKCLVQACQNLNLQFELVDNNKNVVKIFGQYFVNAAVPLNNESVARLVEDKDFTYQTLKNVIKMPKTQGFLDPFIDSSFDEYKQGRSYKELAEQVIKEFSLPVMVKRNTGSRGISVFRCTSLEEIEAAFSKVFNSNDKNYDYVALAQEYIDIKTEYRVIVLDKNIEIVYLKDGKATVVQDQALLNSIAQFLEPIFEILPIRFAGIDLAQDTNGELWLIELNSKPAFDSLAKSSEEIVVKLYEKILKNLQKTKP